MTTWFNKVKWFVVLVLIQGVIISQIQISRYAVPLLYVVFILKLPSDIGRKTLFIYSFLLGLCVDAFGNTPGLNATASLWLAMARPSLLRWQTSRDVSESFVPGIKSMRVAPYFRYMLPSVLLHSAVMNVVDIFSISKLPDIAIATFADALVTVVLLMIIELVGRENSEKGL